MNIIIPSLGRAGIAPSMKWLNKTSRNITFAVHTHEADAYHKAYPEHEVMIVPDECRGNTGKLRDWILRSQDAPFFFVDDDVRLQLKMFKNADEMFNRLEHYIKIGFTMAGIGQQLFSNAAKVEPLKVDEGNGIDEVVKNRFVTLVYAIDPIPFRTLDMSKLRLYEDIALVIHAIQYGGGTISTYGATHTNLTPDQGGCNSWKDEKIILEDLQAICQMYPDICSIRDTNNTTHSKHIGIGLRTAWSKIRKIL